MEPSFLGQSAASYPGDGSQVPGAIAPFREGAGEQPVAPGGLMPEMGPGGSATPIAADPNASPFREGFSPSDATHPLPTPGSTEGNGLPPSGTRR